jgi:hypothetical protein
MAARFITPAKNETGRLVPALWECLLNSFNTFRAFKS